MAIGTQTVVAGVRTTSATSGTSLHVRNVAPQIKMLQPYATPIDNFFMINEKYTNEVTTGIRGKFEWYEDAFLPSLAPISTAWTAGSPTGSFAITGQIFRNNDVFIAEATGQAIRITAAPTYAGGVQTMSAIATVDGSNLSAAGVGTIVQKLAPAYTEAGTKGTSMTVVAANKSGYPQIMKRLLSMTNRQTAANLYGGKDWDYQWRKALLELREEQERAFLNQGASYDDGAVTYTAGCNSFTTNLMTYTGGAITKTAFDAAIKQCMQNGSTFELDAYCGGTALMDISAFITNLLTIQQTTEKLQVSEFGLLTTSPMDTKLVTYMHPMGKVNIYFNPQLRSAYSKHVVFINRENLKKRYMADDKQGSRKYRVELGIQTPGDDSYDAQYLFDVGLQFLLEETFGRLKPA